MRTTLEEQGRREADHLEKWIASAVDILGDDLLLIGRQVSTRTGRLDLLALDRNGNTVIIELKRGVVPREALAQAIDYASDVATWTIERLSEECFGYRSKNLEEIFLERFPDSIMDGITVNGAQRILLVGLALDPALERMIGWLSDKYDIGINAVLLQYARTSSGDEVLMQTTVFPEEIVIEKTKRQKKFQIPRSDEPGHHDFETLRRLWLEYLNNGSYTAKGLREVMLPLCLQNPKVSREMLKAALVAKGLSENSTKAGFQLSALSGQINNKVNDFLRQVIAYEYPNNSWEKENYRIVDDYRDFVEELLEREGPP